MLAPGGTSRVGLRSAQRWWLLVYVLGLAALATSCGAKSEDSAQAAAASTSGGGVICAGYSLDDVSLPEETDFWALRTPATADDRAPVDDWSRGEPCAGARNPGECLVRLDETWAMDRGWGYQGADALSFMVTTYGDRVTRVDSNGALLGLFGGLDQAEKVLFYVGVLGYTPRCSTVEQDADGAWRMEVDLVTSICPYIEQHQSIQVQSDGTLHTLSVLGTIRREDCRRWPSDGRCVLGPVGVDCSGVAAGLRRFR